MSIRMRLWGLVCMVLCVQVASNKAETRGGQNDFGLYEDCDNGWQGCDQCDCCFTSDRTRAVCAGPNITNVPMNLPANTTHLTFSHTNIEELYGQLHPEHKLNVSKFCRYAELQYLSFRENQLLYNLARGSFDLICPNFIPSKLAHILITSSPALKNITQGSLGNFAQLQTLRITKSGLQEVPLWGVFSPGIKSALNVLDLSSNNIKRIKADAFKIFGEVGTLIMDNNDLEEIADFAFKGAPFRIVKIRKNPKLTTIGDDAFTDALLLEELDLSETSIDKLPTNGLNKMTHLTLVDVFTLTVLPPVLKFFSIQEVNLTYPYHCCAFAHPEKQDETFWEEFQRRIANECSTTVGPLTTPMSVLDGFGGFEEGTYTTTLVPDWIKRSLDGVLHKPVHNSYQWHDLQVPVESRMYGDGGWGDPGNSKDLGFQVPKKISDEWHTSTLNPNETHTSIIHCGLGIVVDRVKRAKCVPKPDAFSPCEDVMGFVWLRVIVWFVVMTALIGNLIVLSVTLGSKHKLSVAKFLMANLAFSDFCLGFYLLLLAAIDVHTIGVYFNFAISWQYVGGCQAAGFLAIFSTCLGIFTLTVITLERWYAISHAIRLTKRLKMRQAGVVMTCGWAYSIVMGILPLVGVSEYSKTSICLPMETNKPVDKGYVFFLLFFNAICFIVICFCYVDMYRKVGGNNTVVGRNDANIAKRMAILVFTDFACLFPMAFFGLTAAAGHPLITVTDSKILLVFFLPLNSCANPFLYAIFTKQFRKDLFGMLNRCGVCERQAAKYRAQFTSNPGMSASHSRNSLGAPNTHVRPSASMLATYISSDSRSSKLSMAGSPKNTPNTTPCNSKKNSPQNSPSHKGTKPNTNMSNMTYSMDKIKDTIRKLSIVPELSHISEDDTPVAEQKRKEKPKSENDISRYLRNATQYIMRPFQSNHDLTRTVHGKQPKQEANVAETSLANEISVIDGNHFETQKYENDIAALPVSKSSPAFPNSCIPAIYVDFVNNTNDTKIHDETSSEKVSDKKPEANVNGHIQTDQKVTSDQDKGQDSEDNDVFENIMIGEVFSFLTKDKDNCQSPELKSTATNNVKSPKALALTTEKKSNLKCDHEKDDIENGQNNGKTYCELESPLGMEASMTRPLMGKTATKM